MNLTTVILLNAVLGAALVFALLAHLALGIRHDRRARIALVSRTTYERERDRLAA